MNFENAPTGGVWRKVTAVIDSGSVKPVIPPSVLPEVPILVTEESRAGQTFNGAPKKGEAIKNLGEHVVEGITNEGRRKKMRWTVCDVRRPLISVAALEDAGNEVILGRRPRIVQLASGEVTRLRRTGGVYTMQSWVHIPEQGAATDSPASDFARPW